MVTLPEHRQRIARLTPLDHVLRRIGERVHPVAPREMPAAAALGATLAQDVAVAVQRPAAPVALIDGWAIRSEATADAGSYAPAVLPGAEEINAGQGLPAECDAVAPADAVTWRAGIAESHVAVIPGDGVLMPGTDAGVGEVLRRAGDRLRAIDVAAMQALGLAGAHVRKPRIRIARVGRGRNDILDAAADWLAFAIAADGGAPVAARPGAGAAAFLGGGVDAVIIVGGTGAGSRDDSVHALAQAGTVEAHGIALSPGETAAFGIASSRPVLLVPGRLDAAVAVWLLVGRAMLARLRGGTESEPAHESVLTGKVASTVGLTELVLVRRVADGVEPLASKYLPLATLSHADGWIVVAAESEGLPPGVRVLVRPLP